MKDKLNLSIADCFTLTGLFFAWLAIIFLINGSTNLAVATIMIALVCDLLDGYVARRNNSVSKFGRELDSYADTFIYLIFAALLYHFHLSPNNIFSVAVGFLIVAFGGLRLILFNSEGIKQQEGKDYYRGLTVVHVLFFTIIFYFLSQLTNYRINYLSSVFLAVSSPFMLSNYKSYKITNYWLFALVILCVIATSLVLNYVY